MLIQDRFLSEILAKPAYVVREFNERDFGEGGNAFVFAKVPCEDVSQCGKLEREGFLIVDTNVQLSRPNSGSWVEAAPPAGYTIRFATPPDQSGVEFVAAGSFTHSRFHLDPMIPTETANAIKRQWAGNYFHRKRGDRMVVAQCNEGVIGFLQLLAQPAELIIDLIAVLPSHQGRGLAAAMISFASINCGPWQRMIVGTQIANVRSMRSYEKLGFRLEHAQYVFHYHGPAIAPA